MRKYVAAGIACEVGIYRDQLDFENKFKRRKTEIKEDIKKYINVDNYNIEEKDDFICYNIKEDFVNDHLHNFIKEINPLLDIKNCFLSFMYEKDYDEIDIDSDDFNKDNYNFKLKFFDENYKYNSEKEKRKFKNRYGIEKENNKYPLYVPLYEDNLWMFREKRIVMEDIQIYTSYIVLWFDYNEINGQDERRVIKLLNVFAQNYFKNPLSKDFHFYIMSLDAD